MRTVAQTSDGKWQKHSAATSLKVRISNFFIELKIFRELFIKQSSILEEQYI